MDEETVRAAPAALAARLQNSPVRTQPLWAGGLLFFLHASRYLGAEPLMDPFAFPLICCSGHQLCVLL
jgi:hypothetical protein